MSVTLPGRFGEYYNKKGATMKTKSFFKKVGCVFLGIIITLVILLLFCSVTIGLYGENMSAISKQIAFILLTIFSGFFGTAFAYLFLPKKTAKIWYFTIILANLVLGFAFAELFFKIN